MSGVIPEMAKTQPHVTITYPSCDVQHLPLTVLDANLLTSGQFHRTCNLTHPVLAYLLLQHDLT